MNSRHDARASTAAEAELLAAADARAEPARERREQRRHVQRERVERHVAVDARVPHAFDTLQS